MRLMGKRSVKYGSVVLVAAVVILLGTVFVSDNQKSTDKIVRDMKPNTSTVSGVDYDSVVNRSGGLNVRHTFVYGRYVNGKWTPSGRVFKWSR